VYDQDGDLIAASDNSSAIGFVYNNRQRPISSDNAGTPNAPHVIVNYTYDPANNRLSLADTVNGVADEVESYAYDELNRETQIAQSGAGTSPALVHFSYNELGEFNAIDRFADMVGTQLVTHSAYSYDALNRLISLAHSQGSSPVAFYDQ